MGALKHIITVHIVLVLALLAPQVIQLYTTFQIFLYMYTTNHLVALQEIPHSISYHILMAWHTDFPCFMVSLPE